MITLHNIKKCSVLFFTVLVIIWGQGCTSSNIDLYEKDINSNQVELRIEINRTIQDGLNYESQLDIVRLLMFNTQTGHCIINQTLQINKNDNLGNISNRSTLQFDKISVASGVYDIVLLANENSSIADLGEYREALKLVRNKVDLYRSEFIKIPYKHGTNQEYHHPTGPLLMSAYLKEVKIESNDTGSPQKIKASLMAAMSMIEVVFQNKKKDNIVKHTNKRIEKVVLKNMLKHYSNPAITDSNLSDNSFIDLTTNVNIKEDNYKKEEISCLRYYVPEVIQNEINTIQQKRPSIEVSGSGFHTQEFVFKNTKKAFIDDLKSQDRIFTPGIDKLQLEGDNTSNLIRNRIYRITILLGVSGNTLESKFEILPWEVKQSYRDYGKAKFDIKYNQNLADPENHQFNVSANNKVTFTLNLEEPIGAPWRISLTNALDFAVVPHPVQGGSDTKGATKGVVGKEANYKFDIIPLRPFTGLPNYTEIFLVVDGKEEQLIPNLKESNIPSGPHNRYKIKQVE